MQNQIGLFRPFLLDLLCTQNALEVVKNKKRTQDCQIVFFGNLCKTSDTPLLHTPPSPPLEREFQMLLNHPTSTLFEAYSAVKPSYYLMLPNVNWTTFLYQLSHNISGVLLSSQYASHHLQAISTFGLYLAQMCSWWSARMSKMIQTVMHVSDHQPTTEPVSMASTL